MTCSATEFARKPVRRKDGALWGPVRAWSTLIHSRDGMYEMGSRATAFRNSVR
jgi:hypothetical protein